MSGAICPDCGTSVAKRGLAKHRGSAVCEVAADVRAMSTRGWVTVHGNTARAALTRGLPHDLFEEARTGIDGGSSGRRQIVKWGTYAPAWVSEILSGIGPVAQRVELVRVLHARRDLTAAELTRWLVTERPAGTPTHTLLLPIATSLAGEPTAVVIEAARATDLADAANAGRAAPDRDATSWFLGAVRLRVGRPGAEGLASFVRILSRILKPVAGLAVVESLLTEIPATWPEFVRLIEDGLPLLDACDAAAPRSARMLREALRRPLRAPAGAEVTA